MNVRAQDEEVFALAKKEFGIPDFLKKHPTYDGRGIVGGVIDDGVSPHHSGFQRTTTGERKYIGHFSNSTEFTFDLIDNVEETVEFDGNPITPKHIVIFDEKKFGGDYNGDGEKTELKFIIHSNESGDFLCLDQDRDNQYAKTDCQRDFKSTGEYGFWLPSKSIPMMAWIELEKKKLRISEGEWKETVTEKVLLPCLLGIIFLVNMTVSLQELNFLIMIFPSTPTKQMKRCIPLGSF